MLRFLYRLTLAPKQFLELAKLSLDVLKLTFELKARNLRAL